MNEPTQPVPSPRRGFGPERKTLIILWGIVLLMALGAPLMLNLGALAHKRAAPHYIQKLLDAQVEAWNRGDLDGFMAGYWNSIDLEFMSGTDVTYGWQATLVRYRTRYQAEGQEMGRLEFVDIKIEVEDHEKATAKGTWRLVQTAKLSQGKFALNLRRFDDGWKIVRDHTTLEKLPEVGPPAP
jgi:beta-aspartyl-peptidase (threonine type)